MDNPFPPFDPDGDNSDQPAEILDGKTRLRDIPLRAIFPNLLTLLAICSGLTSIRFAIEGKVEFAVAAIILAGFLDGIDGRVARFLKSASRFGEQMDSLADFVNFGVAPAMLLYFTILTEMGSLGWIAALIYVICACMRLARFNVMLDNPNTPAWHGGFFVGVPAPAAALIVLLPVYLTLLGFESSQLWGWGTTVFTIFSAFLMVSSLPTFSGKDFSRKMRRDLVTPFMILTVFIAAMLLSYPWLTLTAFGSLYLLSLPFSMRSWNQNLASNSVETRDD